MGHLLEQMVHLLFKRNHRWRKHTQRLRIHRNLNAAISHDRLTVEVHHPRMLTDNRYLMGLHRLDLAIPINLLGKELNSQWRYIQWSERRQDRDIHLPILHIGMWSDEGIVAILRGIGARHQESLLLDRLVVHQKLIGLRFVTQVLLDGILNISKRTSSGLIGEFLADRRIKPHTAGTEKDLSIRLAAIAWWVSSLA